MDLRNELLAEIRAERYDLSNEGIFFPLPGVMVVGEYFSRHRPGGKIVGGFELDRNAVVLEGRVHLLNVAMGGKAKAGGYYLTLFNGAAAPADNWTAAAFSATAGEIVSLTEGYSNPTRPVWTPVDASASSAIDNFAAVATFNIATAGTVTVTGAALLTASARGATTGSLISATRYAAERVFQNGDAFDVGYRMSLTA